MRPLNPVWISATIGNIELFGPDCPQLECVGTVRCGWHQRPGRGAMKAEAIEQSPSWLSDPTTLPGAAHDHPPGPINFGGPTRPTRALHRLGSRLHFVTRYVLPRVTFWLFVGV